MNRLEINPNNEKYYSKDFMQGYRCGTKSQFDADVKVLEQIRQEIIQMNSYDYVEPISCEEVLEIIDKYK